MFIKRAKHTMRNKLVTFTQLTIPLFCTILILIVVRTLPGQENSTPLSLNVTAYDSNTIVYSEKGRGEDLRSLGHYYSKQFKNPNIRVENVQKRNQFVSHCMLGSFDEHGIKLLEK
jgi:hypothetical protein